MDDPDLWTDFIDDFWSREAVLLRGSQIVHKMNVL
jgi:hypothetical protein